jgi:hypothetical protein
LSSKERCFPTKGGKHERGETYFSSPELFDSSSKYLSNQQSTIEL